MRRISPKWLQAYWGGRLIYSIALQLDALGDGVKFGVMLRFPNAYSPESLPLIGRERGILRGFDESDEAYGLRLRTWLDDHQRAGSPYILIRQVQGYLAPHVVPARTVNDKGAWQTIGADGVKLYTLGGNWNWDGDESAQSRFWLILYPPADLWVRDGVWGDGGLWGDGGTWGSTATIEQIETVQQIVAQWRPPHSFCMNIIVAFDPTAFDPSDTAPPLPDGDWNLAGNRDPRAIYWDGEVS